MGIRLCPIRAAGRRVLKAGALLSACTCRPTAGLPILVSGSAVKVLVWANGNQAKVSCCAPAACQPPPHRRPAANLAGINAITHALAAS